MHWLRRAMSPLHHKDLEQEALMGVWRVPGSTRLQNLALRSVFVLNSTPSGTRGMLSIAGPNNIQKDGVKSHPQSWTVVLPVRVSVLVPQCSASFLTSEGLALTD
eukprot:718556-Pelagomonas_calceolata.AAC.1